MPKYGTYQEVHDELLRKYRRYALYSCWTGILSLICLFIFSPKYLQGEEAISLGGVYNLAVILGLTITQAVHGPKYLFVIIAGVVTLLLGGLFGFLGYKAYKGYKWALITSIIVYGIDALIFSFTPLISFYNFLPMDYILTILVHVMIIGIMIFALVKRQELVYLVKTRRGKVLIKDVKSDKKVILSYRKDQKNNEKIIFADDSIDENANNEEK